MEEGTVEVLGDGASRLIGRPRLVRQLDERESRIALLVAPAGYGKTTLAREWLAGKVGVWYQVTPASRDVAALGLGLRKAMAELVPEPGERLPTRLSSASDPEGQAEELADLLAQDIAEWPEGAHLVIDDYQHIVDVEAAERFMAAFVAATEMPLLFTSRARPTWVTAKHVLYGEVFELGRDDLAMTPDEADAVLSRGAGGRRQSDLVAQAQGWPAVIGLAALLPGDVEHEAEAIPEALHAYFAEELYQGMPRDLQWALAQLSLAPTLSPALAVAVFGDVEISILEAAYGRGFLTRHKGRYDLHPLIRQFLRRKLEDNPKDKVEDAAASLAQWYLERGSWDEAFTLAEEFDIAHVAVCIIERGLDPVLSAGRLTTLERWLELGRRLAPLNPTVRFGDIEAAFRARNWSAAELNALRLTKELAANDPLAARVFFRAGQIAQLDDRPEEALERFTLAAQRGQAPTDLRRALWSRFVTLSDLEDSVRALKALEEFERQPTESAEDVVRASQGRLHWALRWGGITHELNRQSSALTALDRVDDPIVRTGYLQSYGCALSLAADYPSARAVSERELREIESSQLDWARPHALQARATSELGLRQFDQAVKTLQTSYTLAAESSDLHSQMNSVAIAARVFLSRGESDRASSILDTEWDRPASPSMQGDYFATRALVLACCRRADEAEHFSGLSESVTDQIDSRALLAYSRAIVAHLQDRADATSVLQFALSESQATGNFDALVCAYRAVPSLLRAVKKLEDAKAYGARRVILSVDPALGQRAGFRSKADPLRPSGGQLTHREHEVFDLLRQGLTNRQIGQSLWITESTAKAHVRHILAKLGARSRTEAARREPLSED